MDNYIFEILMTMATAVASFIGITIKNAYVKYVDTKTKKEIVKATVNYVEQVSSSIIISSEDKFNKAKNKSLEWLTEKGIKISDTELEVLIESAVNEFNSSLKGGK